MKKSTGIFSPIVFFLSQPPALTGFVLISFVIAFSNISLLHNPFYFDALRYWQLSSSFIKDGSFALTNFASNLRGYLFPLLLFPFAGLGGMGFGAAFFVLCSAPMYGAFLTVLVPKLFELIFKRSPSTKSVLLFSFLVIIFWRGYFYYPITDLPAIIFLCLAFYFVLKYFETWWGAVLVGIFLSGAGLIRPVYQIVLIPAILWIMYFCIYQKKLRVQRAIIQLVLLFIGLGSVYVPQLLINMKSYGVVSPFVRTGSNGGPDLFTLQLNWGIDLQKYETNVGKNYPSPRVLFIDRQGEQALFDLGAKSKTMEKTGQIGPDKPFSLQEYLGMVVTHPLTFTGIYLRHLFNGLDLHYDTPYIEDVFSFSFPRQLANYTVWFLSLGFLAAHLKRWKGLIPQLALLLIFCLPVLPTIPTAVEVRFMLPAHILAYAVLTFGVLPETLQLKKEEITRVIIRTLPFYLAFIAICFLLAANTYAGLQYLVQK